MVNIPLSKSGLKLFSNDVEETIDEELPITEESLEELKNSPESFSATIVTPSKVEKNYYNDFDCSLIYFETELPIDVKDREIFYSSDGDFTFVARNLTQNQERALLFIAAHKSVQTLHLKRELGIGGEKLKSIISFLWKAQLINKWKFNRADNDETAYTYTISRNGAYVARATNKIMATSIYDWQAWFRTDDLQHIRMWKLVDAYQILSKMEGYQTFNPLVVYPETSVKKAGKRRYIPSVALNGLIEFKLSDSLIKFGLVPILDKRDNRYLNRLFLQWSTIQKDNDYLLLVVDDIERMKELYVELDMASIDLNLLFMDLSTAHETDLRKAVFLLVGDEKGNKEFKTVDFRIDISGGQ